MEENTKTLPTKNDSRAKPKSNGLKPYEDQVARELRVLIAEKGLRLKAISNALEDLDIRESEKGLSAKIAAGTFSAAYFAAIKKVISAL